MQASNQGYWFDPVKWSLMRWGVLFILCYRDWQRTRVSPNVALQNSGPPDQLGVWSSGPRYTTHQQDFTPDATYNEWRSLTCLISTQMIYNWVLNLGWIGSDFLIFWPLWFENYAPQSYHKTKVIKLAQFNICYQSLKEDSNSECSLLSEIDEKICVGVNLV